MIDHGGMGWGATGGFFMDDLSPPTTPNVPESATTKVVPPAQRILVAEDEHLIAVDLSNQLHALGFEVIGPAANGNQAIELAKEHQPDLALLDIRMPEMDGLAAAGVLFCQMNVPVVIVSAYSDADYLDIATRVGVFGYMLKPVTRETLRVNIAVAWARYQQHLKLRQRIGELENTLEERKLIEKAKGLLMQKMGITEAEALNRLRRKARDSRRRMADLAQAILEAHDLFET